MGSTSPKIRFSGFTNPWEQRELGDYLSPSTRKNSNLEFEVEDVFSVSWTEGVVNQIELQGRSYAGADLSGYDVVEGGDVVYTKSPLRDEPYGIVKTNRCGSGIVSQLYAVYHPLPNVDSEFVEYYFGLAGRLNMYFKPLVNKGAKNTMNISDDGALLGAVTFPTLPEQRAIGSFFLSMDNLIDLHQDKYERLVQIKSELISKMFPKPGERVPEVRFNGCHGPWEQHKLGEMVSRVTDSCNDTNLPRVSYEDILSGDGRLNKQIDKLGRAGSGVAFRSGDILYGKLRPYLHNWLFPQFRGIALGDFWIFRPLGIDPGFLYRLIQTDSFDRLANVSAGSKMPRADWQLMSNASFSVPVNGDEQQAIGSFFLLLDDLITLHQGKLKMLKALKKAFLNKMFV